jgi:hypothetical protein
VLEFQRGFLRHRHRQRRQRLETCRMAGDRSRQGVVGPPRHVDAFRPEVMKRGRGQRQDLNVDARFVHQGEPVLGEIEQPTLNLARMECHARIDRVQTNGVPRFAYLSGQEMPFDTD